MRASSLVPESSTPEAAFRALYDTLSRGLELVAIRELGDRDEARDVVQESMARAFDAVQRDRVPEGVPLGAFVRGIARHVIADTLRRRARTAGASLARALSVPTADLSVLDLIISDERARLVRDALGRLSRADRELLERSLLDGESLVDIARRSGVQPERVRKRKSRAMERLLGIIRPDACHASDQFNDNGS